MSGENLPPLTTLEVATASGLDYTRYWQHFRITRNLVNLDDVQKTCRLGSYLGQLTRDVILGNDLSETELMPDMQTGAPQAATISNAVEEWDKVTGSRNPLENAQPDLLRAAGLLLYANFTGEPDEFVLPTTDSEMVYDHFMSLMGNNDLERQRPGGDLLLAGQLIHKAAWKETDPTRQEDLFKTAAEVYDRIHGDSDAVGVDRLLAGQYRADIHFQWLNQEMHEAVRLQDKEAQVSLRDIAKELLKEMAADLQHAGRLAALADASNESVGGLTGSGWAGFMLESFAIIAARDLLYLRSKPSVAARYEVRRAFRHEDEPRNLKLKPKQSFDVVVQRRDVTGNIVETTPVQFKLRSKLHSPRPGKRDKDYKGIPCIGVYGLGTTKMTRAIDNLLVGYAEEEFTRDRGPLNEVQELFGALVDRRLVATLHYN